MRRDVGYPGVGPPGVSPAQPRGWPADRTPETIVRRGRLVAAVDGVRAVPGDDRAGHRWRNALFVAPYVVATALGGGLILRGGTAQPMAVPAMTLFGVVGLVLALRCWRCGALDHRTRRAWGIVSLAFAQSLIFPVLFEIAPSVRFPAPGDVVRIGFTLTLAAGLLAFPLRPTAGSERRRTAFDVSTVVLGGFIVMWYLVVGPGIVATGTSLDKIVAASVYPATDLLLIFSVATVLLRTTDPSTRRPLSTLAAAAGFFVVGDVYLGYLRSHDLPIKFIDTWPLLVYLTAHVLLAGAGLQQYRRAGRSQAVSGAPRRVPAAARLPYAAVGLGYSLMIVAAIAEKHLFPWSGLVLGGACITAVVVARQVMVQRESHQMAVTDALTGLSNRSQLYDTLTRALQQGAYSRHGTAVVIADMNGFKQVNDTMGHKAGDQVLVAFSAALRRSVLGSDPVARLGGDEFAIVLHDIDEFSTVEVVLRRILAEMREPVLVDGRPVMLRASFGVALSAPGEANADDLLHRADQAMYRAKRDTTEWAYYDPSMVQGDEQSLDDDLRGAVQAGQLRLHYQPVVDIVDGQPRAVEALVRWEHPARGLLPPAQFIPAAERIGVIAEIGEWVLEQACRQVEAWQRRYAAPPLELSVNVSPHQLGRATFADTVLDIVRRTGFNPRHLILEVTESSLVEGEQAIGQLARLRDAGIRIALDDFGSGYSSLRYLTRLPVDILKLDRSLVSELDGTPGGSAVATAVLRLGEALHLQTVAEGVECASQAQELTLLGCQFAQGFHFARPMPETALQDLLDGVRPTRPAPSVPQR